MAIRRLSHADRHVQLLDAAMSIVRADGADALTLARVAEVAGVSKPVVYEHFETRSGLLKALYRRIDAQQSQAAQAMLTERARTLEGTVQLLSTAYVDCVLHIGMEFGSVTAALSAITELEDLVRDGRERYAEIYLEALRQFLPTPGADASTVMLGVIGAAETLSREVTAGRLERASAIMAIGRIMLGAVSPVNAPV